MELKNKVELIKRLDEHDCILCCSSQAPLDFILCAIEDFKNYILQCKERQKNSAEESKSCVQEVKEEPKAE